MRLNQRTIHEIVAAYDRGEALNVIAERFAVDSTTVRYHVEQFSNRYGATSVVYALIPVEDKPKPPCQHPSLKCLLCGKAQDYIHRRELEKIRQLNQALDRANARLIEHGFEPETGAV